MVIAIMVMVSAVVMVAVAFADIVIVVPLIELMVVLAGMPAPVRTCPTASPAALDTLVRVGLPLVVMAVNALVALAAADIVIVVPLIALMVVLSGMGPVLVMGSAVVMV